MFDFAETTKDMTAVEILNYYRNLYYAEPQVTERGIVANAINDYFKQTADVAPRAEVFEVVDKFRSDLMDKFLDLCRGNDYNKLTLLKIGDTVGQIYDKQIAELKKKYTGGH